MGDKPGRLVMRLVQRKYPISLKARMAVQQGVEHETGSRRMLPFPGRKKVVTSCGKIQRSAPARLKLWMEM